SGEIAQHFVKWVGTSRIDTNEYYITCTKEELKACDSSVDNLRYIDIDPTSLMRIRNIMEDKNFATIFIVMENRQSAEYAYRNIRMVTAKSLIFFVSSWNDIRFDDDNLSILNVNEIMALNLYEKLPNVPLVAKNIGLGKGEIMEMMVPFGSSFAYKHLGTIGHRKWRIVAIYRKGKQIFVTSATMLHPNDRLIVIGNPLVLEEVYKKVNLRQGAFPEPFGKNLYLLIDVQQPKEEILIQVNEAIYLSNQLKKSRLYIRLINANDFEVIRELRALQTDDISVMVTYIESKNFDDIDFDISQYEIGLFMLDRSFFFKTKFKKHFLNYQRPIYLFGEKSVYNIKQAVILMGEESVMESLSTSIFDFSESLGLELSLCDYSPEGDFQDTKQIEEHYESLSRLYNFKVKIEKKRVNPIRELLEYDEVLHVTPFVKEIKEFSLLNLFSTKHDTYSMSIKKHPQLLIPVDK
ncbi:MAG: TrkA domain protein, partial [uncultured Sulfurovum sp.]